MNYGYAAKFDLVVTNSCTEDDYKMILQNNIHKFLVCAINLDEIDSVMHTHNIYWNWMIDQKSGFASQTFDLVTPETCKIEITNDMIVSAFKPAFHIS